MINFETGKEVANQQHRLRASYIFLEIPLINDCVFVCPRITYIFVLFEFILAITSTLGVLIIRKRKFVQFQDSDLPCYYHFVHYSLTAQNFTRYLIVTANSQLPYILPYVTANFILHKYFS